MRYQYLQAAELVVSKNRNRKVLKQLLTADTEWILKAALYGIPDGYEVAKTVVSLNHQVKMQMMHFC